jgi:hypothetical protein
MPRKFYLSIPLISGRITVQCGDEMFRALAARDRAMLLLGFDAALRSRGVVHRRCGSHPGPGRAAAGPPFENRPAGPGAGGRDLGQPG